MVNTSTPVTQRRAYRKPGNGNENTLEFGNSRANGGFDDIDADMHTQVGRIDSLEDNTGNQGTTILTLQGDVSTNSTDIATNESNITDLQNQKAGLRTLPTTASITYNANGDMTSYQDSQYSANNFVYDADGDLESLEETVDGVTYLVTLVYNGNKDLVDITSVEQ